jgi:adenylate kinase
MARFFLISALFAATVPAQPAVNGPVFILIGPPGSGKSTQAKAAADALKIPVISAEEMIASNPAAFKKHMQPGITGMNPRTDPVLNEIFGALVESGKYRNGFILDGYPATKDHADYVRKMVNDGRLPNPLVVRLEISDDDLRKRLGKKADETFEQLLKDYHRELDMMDVYFPGSRAIAIDGTGTPAEVTERIRKQLSELAPENHAG